MCTIFIGSYVYRIKQNILEKFYFESRNTRDTSLKLHTAKRGSVELQIYTTIQFVRDIRTYTYTILFVRYTRTYTFIYNLHYAIVYTLHVEA